MLTARTAFTAGSTLASFFTGPAFATFFTTRATRTAIFTFTTRGAVSTRRSVTFKHGLFTRTLFTMRACVRMQFRWLMRVSGSGFTMLLLAEADGFLQTILEAAEEG